MVFKQIRGLMNSLIEVLLDPNENGLPYICLTVKNGNLRCNAYLDKEQTKELIFELQSKLEEM